MDGPAFRPDPQKDSFLASFPRSGNTWMRAVLFHYLYDRPAKTFAELHLGVPDEHLRIPARKIFSADYRNSHPRVVKTHKTYEASRNYVNVAYILRDPRDSLPSYWKYLKRQNSNFSLSFEDFLCASLNGAIGPCSWQEHLRSWVNAGARRIHNITIVRYEDLRDNDQSASQLLSQGLNLPDEVRLRELICEYDLAKMKALEERSTNERSGRESTASGFIGAGAASADFQETTEDMIRKNAPEWLDMMNRFGYMPR